MLSLFKSLRMTLAVIDVVVAAFVVVVVVVVVGGDDGAVVIPGMLFKNSSHDVQLLNSTMCL